MSEPKKNLIQLINQLILEEHYDGIQLLLHDNKNVALLKSVYSEAIEICTTHLTDDNFKNNLELYYLCEQLLTFIAQNAPQEEVLFELLEIVETTKSDNVFTSALKGLQICLLRLKENKVRALEWCLNSIQNYLCNLKVPESVEKGYDEKQEKLLEQDEHVHRILTSYITVFLFYEPILKELAEKKVNDIFKHTAITRRNVLICFLIQLLGKPLALLDLSNREKPTNSHSLQCAKTLCKDLSLLLADPFFLLYYVEARVRWKTKFPDDGVYELASRDIFFIAEKVPLIAVGIYYYLLLAEGMLSDEAPKVYRSMYIFEMCLYLVVEMLSNDESPIQYKGILLGMKTLENLNNEKIVSNALDLTVHATFCDKLTKVVIFSAERNRKIGILLFKKYILQFEDEGKFFLLKNLMKITTHNGLFGYITTLYKNLVAEQLETSQGDLPEYFVGKEFKSIMLNFICKLQTGAEIDVMEYSDRIISALNIVRYFVIADKKNRTGFWNFINEIETNFLEPLRTALELSQAHYQAEEYRVRNDLEDIPNDKVKVALLSGENLPSPNKQHKLTMLANAIMTFELIRSLLGRVNECINANK